LIHFYKRNIFNQAFSNHGDEEEEKKDLAVTSFDWCGVFDNNEIWQTVEESSFWI